MKIRKMILGIVFLMGAGAVYSQKIVSDLTISYDITVESKSDKPQIANMFNGATTTVYIKNSNHRTESVNSLGTSTVIYDGKLKTAVVLKEYGAQKILIKMSQQNWLESNSKYDAIVYTPTNETKVILGKNCTKYTGKMKDGTEFIVFSTKDINLENKDYNAQFKNAGGLVLEYIFTVNGVKITNTASSLNENSINPTKFEAPKSGFREMTYEESKAS